MSLPDRFHISWRNDITAFTLAADVTVETAYPLTNCQNTIANEWAVLDMTGETTVAITGSSATTRVANCFAVHNHNAPDETTCRLRLYAGETQTGTVVYDSDNDATYGATDMFHNIPIGSLIAGHDGIEDNFEDGSQLKTHYSQWFEAVQYKSFKIDITNAGGFTDDALRIDKLWLGYAHSPEATPENGVQATLIDDSVQKRKPGGGMETMQGDVRRSMTMDFTLIENSERHIFRRAFDVAKMGGDLLITLDPNDTQSLNYETTSIYCRTSQVSFTARFYNRNALGLAVEEN